MSDMLITNRNEFNNQQLINNHEMYNANATVKNNVDETNPSGIKQKLANKAKECETCKNRRYQDGSDDPGVSFQSPTKLDPSKAATEVYSHEREHYVREEAKAQSEGEKVLSNTIKIFTSICPECGRPYVCGGETTTVTAKKEEEKLSFAKDFYESTVGKYRAREIDTKA